MMTMQEATDIAAAGKTAEMITARLSGDAGALLEIALLALAEAAYITEDETPLQEDIDDAAAAVREAMRSHAS